MTLHSNTFGNQFVACIQGLPLSMLEPATDSRADRLMLCLLSETLVGVKLQTTPCVQTSCLDLLKWGLPLKTYTLAIAANATDVAAVRVSTPNFT
ncbi:hypothetical protein BV349_04780 [Pseudomonas syringae pv. actinidiae]|nr:hypothetical protein BV349_04780 [Pseudomonas syringae pv. actinidiae]OSN73201.1 hypothetical protein BV351_04517 [Pseudomonas syringae pv. actinidiae]RMS15740.1 hypothetical protein ALP75_200616 [Pseudomonas syringae pv. actinidiae]